jgi:CubicO group peptidase (beta-lactamase class C family)
MRRFVLKVVLGAILALAQPLPTFAQSSSVVTELRHGIDSARLAGLVDWLKTDVERGRIPGAVVLVARDGKILLHEAVGWADKGKKIPMALDSIHPIASASKLITTVAALRLVEENKIKMMAPIASYLPELKDLKVAVARGDGPSELVNPVRGPNIHDLMTHRAGFTYFFHPNNPLRGRYRELGIDRIDNMTADEMLQKLGTLPLAFQPATAFEYSIATDILGHIIERVTKQPLDRALREIVLDPLQMVDTTFHLQGEALQRLALPSSNDPDPWIFEWLNIARAPKRFAGGAGLASTASDYYRVLQMLMNGGVLDGARVLSPMTVRWAMADHIGTMRGMSHPGDGYSWNLFNPVRVEDGRALFPGNIGDVFWGGITGPRYFLDPKERLIAVLFVQAPSQRASYHAELRAMVYGSLGGSSRD